MKVTLYQVDAFARRVFEGNPAAVCPLEHWPENGILQAIAEENNLSETAFFVPSAAGFELRWFTPLAEVDLCGHATLACAHVLFEELAYPEPVIRFRTRSGELSVERRDGLLVMNFPARPPLPCAAPSALIDGLGARPAEVLAADDYIAVFDGEAAIRALEPDMARLRELGLRGICVTAPGTGAVDFVSRFFAPGVGVPEDPVTGSAHCELAPYWAARLGRNRLLARQVSRRGGDIACELQGDRVILAGAAVTFMKAEITLDGCNQAVIWVPDQRSPGGAPMTEPRLHWDDSFLIGINELDFEHKRLIADITRLHRELSGQDDQRDIEACLGEIFARMQAHFALEERVMRENKYPGFDEHKREHEALLDNYTASMLDFINSPGGERGRPIEDALERWIVDHILISDRKMSAMIKDSSK